MVTAVIMARLRAGRRRLAAPDGQRLQPLAQFLSHERDLVRKRIDLERHGQPLHGAVGADADGAQALVVEAQHQNIAGRFHPTPSCWATLRALS